MNNVPSPSCRVRFAPSPTGFMHLGNGRTALMNALFARNRNGAFFLRLDDTDTQRSEERFTQALLEDLAWLGLDFDALYRQSQRLELYRQHVDLLKAKGLIYPCYETGEELAHKRDAQLARKTPPLYDRHGLTLSDAQRHALEAEGRRPHWRFRLSGDCVRWDDLLRGPLTCQLSSLSDPIVVREDGTVGFLLAGAIDDWDLKITHILRGEDHITNTAVQLDMLRALEGWDGSLAFGHFPLLTDEAGKGFSKRLGSLSLQELRRQGVFPLAVASFLEALGTADAPQVPDSLTTRAAHFSLSRYGRAAPKLAIEDLWRLNRKFFQTLPFDAVLKGLKEHGIETPLLEKLTPPFWDVVRDSIDRLEDVVTWMNICGLAPHHDILPHAASPEEAAKIATLRELLTADFITQAIQSLPPQPWSDETWGMWGHTLKELTGRKGATLYGPLRLALTGRLHGPHMASLLPFFSHECVLSRLQAVASHLSPLKG